MSEHFTEFDPRHPHERDGRDEPPVIDKDGRCLVCCRDYGDTTLKPRIADLEARVREVESENERLRKELPRMVNGLRSHLNNIASRIGPARRPEGIKDEIESLSDNYAHWADRSAESDLAAARVAIGELSGALKPFSALYQNHHHEAPDGCGVYAINQATVYVGDLRHAAALVARYGP